MVFNKRGYDSLEDLYRESEKLVYAFIRDYTSDENLVIELSQVVWYKVWKNFDKFRNKDRKDAQNYIRAIARNTVADHFKSEKQELEAFEEISCLYGGECNMDTEKEIKDLLNRELQEYLEEAYGVLSDSEAELVKLKYGDNLKSGEIGELLGISDALVRVRLQRIREKLKKEIIMLQRRDNYDDK